MLKKSANENFKDELKQQFANSADFSMQTFEFENQKIELFYLSSLCDEKKIKKEILLPFFKKNKVISFEKYIEGLPNTSAFESKQKVLRYYNSIHIFEFFIVKIFKKKYSFFNFCKIIYILNTIEFLVNFKL